VINFRKILGRNIFPSYPRRASRGLYERSTASTTGRNDGQHNRSCPTYYTMLSYGCLLSSLLDSSSTASHMCTRMHSPTISYHAGAIPFCLLGFYVLAVVLLPLCLQELGKACLSGNAASLVRQQSHGYQLSRLFGNRRSLRSKAS
jgi:hypothetical protein